MIFDSHAHYDDKQFQGDREDLLSRMRERGIGRIVNVGDSIRNCKRSLELSRRYPEVYAAVGVHPSNISCLNDEEMAWLKEVSFQEKVVAIGEIGLDYYWDKEFRVQQEQKIWFKRQLQLARERDLPVIIHSRDAAEDTFVILKEEAECLKKPRKEPFEHPLGVIHCFSYSKEMALEYVKMGYLIGIGGVWTFRNSRNLKEAVAELPLEAIVVETDCPYLAPEPHRGQRNESAYISYVLEEIARLKGLTVAQVEEATYQNACRLYRLS